MIPPKWFLRDLEIIDKSYFPAWNEKAGYWEIKKKMHEYYMGRSRGRSFVAEVLDPTIGVFKELNNNVLDNIRQRKKLSIQYPGASYLKWIMDQAKESKAKKNALAVEMATEGFMRIFNQGKSKQFDMAVPEKN
jgi:hypothetical protein